MVSLTKPRSNKDIKNIMTKTLMMRRSKKSSAKLNIGTSFPEEDTISMLSSSSSDDSDSDGDEENSGVGAVAAAEDKEPVSKD